MKCWFEALLRLFIQGKRELQNFQPILVYWLLSVKILNLLPSLLFLLLYFEDISKRSRLQDKYLNDHYH